MQHGLNYAFHIEAKIAKIICNGGINSRKVNYPTIVRTGFSEKFKSWAVTFNYLESEDLEWYEDFMISNYPYSGFGNTVDEALIEAMKNLCKAFDIKIEGFKYE